MLSASENLNFELAAQLRDQLNAVESLGKKQIVTAGASAEMDVIGYGKTQTKACFAVLHYRDGNLLDKDYDVFAAPEDDDAALSALIKQYYLSRGYAPKNVLLPFAVDDMELFSRLLEQSFGKKTAFLLPQRGEKRHLVELAVKNANEEAKRLTLKEEQRNATLSALSKMLGVPKLKRIESYDISNISGTDMVGSCVVFVDGKPKRGDYKRFKIRDLTDQDDYAAMRQVLERRLRHFIVGDQGFELAPDVLLIDGGIMHAKTALSVLDSLELHIPVFGMVKDDRHRTRALVTAQGEQIRIDNHQAVFSLIGNIQEETHRFAISYHRQLRSKRLQYSELDEIPGIGPKRKQDLLKTFKSLAGIRGAELMELERILPRDAAAAVYRHFHKEDA
jgi:excinuclease ABC subunit C